MQSTFTVFQNFGRIKIVVFGWASFFLLNKHPTVCRSNGKTDSLSKRRLYSELKISNESRCAVWPFLRFVNHTSGLWNSIALLKGSSFTCSVNSACRGSSISGIPSTASLCATVCLGTYKSIFSFRRSIKSSACLYVFGVL